MTKPSTGSPCPRAIGIERRSASGSSIRFVPALGRVQPSRCRSWAQGTIRPRALPDHSPSDLARLVLLLDAGEASAIRLAEQTQCRFLLIDARRGRQIARARGIPVVGLAGVLLAAKRSGLLPSVASALADLSREGYRLSEALVSEALRLAGKAESAV